MPSLGEQITKDRKAKEMSQKELAGLVRKEDGQPISPQFLNDLERDRRRPSNQILKKFSPRSLVRVSMSTTCSQANCRPTSSPAWRRPAGSTR